MTGRGLILEYAMGVATIAFGWSGDVAGILRDAGIVIPPKRDLRGRFP